MDVHLVTVAAFRRFVKETGYVTLAERPLDPAEYPDADPDLLHPGSLVFARTSGPVDLATCRTGGATSRERNGATRRVRAQRSTAEISIR